MLAGYADTRIRGVCVREDVKTPHWVPSHPDCNDQQLRRVLYGAVVALSLGMTKLLLTHKQAMLAVDLGCCVAMGTSNYVVGHAYPAACTALPPADLRTYPGPDGHVYVEALTEDGATFLSLVEA